MPAGARRSLASPVVNGVLCQCGGGGAAAATSPPATCGPVPASEGSESSSALCALEQERRVHSLFLQLDVNRDGALCVHDLAVGLGRLGLHRSERDLRTLETFLSSHVSRLSRFQHVSCATCLLVRTKKYGQLSPTVNYRGWYTFADLV